MTNGIVFWPLPKVKLRASTISISTCTKENTKKSSRVINDMIKYFCENIRLRIPNLRGVTYIMFILVHINSQ